MPRILLMEDSIEQAELLSEWLEIVGHDVSVANRIETALEIFNGGRQFDLVITDIFAPGGVSRQIEKGLTFIEQIRSNPDERLSSVPIISISGVRIERSFAYRFDDVTTLGSDAHLAKPFKFDVLSQTIRELLEPAAQPLIDGQALADAPAQAMAT